MNLPDVNTSDNQYFMRLALAQAELAFQRDEVPIGCVVVHRGRVIGSGHNLRENARVATAHAELLAIERASLKLGGWRLTDCDLYVTIEPCAMCAGLIYQARIRRLIYGAPDPKGGACGSAMNILSNPHINHRVSVTSGVLAAECAQILQRFFKQKR